MEQQTEFQNIKSHIEWAFRGHDVGDFGHNVQGQETYGIYYKRMVFADQLEKMNQLGLEVQHIQQTDNDIIIVVVAVRR